jgi:hypothetical protein
LIQFLNCRRDLTAGQGLSGMRHTRRKIRRDTSAHGGAMAGNVPGDSVEDLLQFGIFRRFGWLFRTAIRFLERRRWLRNPARVGLPFFANTIPGRSRQTNCCFRSGT